MPRDRNGTFSPVIVPKRKRCLTRSKIILSLYARGMSTRDEHLGVVYGVHCFVAVRITEW